jgi:hypothetical protein
MAGQRSRRQGSSIMNAFSTAAAVLAAFATGLGLAVLVNPLI